MDSVSQTNPETGPPDSEVVPTTVLKPWREWFLRAGRKAKRSQAPLWNETKFWVLSRFTWLLVNLVMLTCRVRIGRKWVLQERWKKDGTIYALWHNKTLVPVYFFRGRGLRTLISLSRDGHYQANIFRYFGWRPLRGSTSRGGTEALRRCVAILRKGQSIGITPDGPKGPPHQVQPGVILMASLSQRPIVPVGIASNPQKCLGTWDRYMIPKPFATTAIFFGDPIIVGPDISREDIPDLSERIRQAIEAAEGAAREMVTVHTR